MKLPQIVMISGALTSALFFTGCATITRGSTEQLVVQSNPVGASVRLDSGQTGIAPATFTVPRKHDIIVTVSAPGYRTVSVAVTSQIAGRGAAGMAGNVLIGGIIGIGVDAYSGATLSHYPNPLVVNLEPESGPAPAPMPVVVPAAKPVEPAQPAVAEKPAEPAPVAPPPAAEKPLEKPDTK